MASPATLSPVNEVIAFFARASSREEIAAFHLSPPAHHMCRSQERRQALEVGNHATVVGASLLGHTTRIQGRGYPRECRGVTMRWPTPIGMQGDDEGEMATSAYSLPEAQERVEELQEIVAASEHAELSADHGLDLAVSLIRRADDLLAHLPAADEVTREETTLRVLTQTLRVTAFLLVQEIDPEQAWYWTAENQARIHAGDNLLTPDLRAEVLAEAAADYAALEQDPIALAEYRAENAAWETTVGDGIDAD